MRPGPRPSEAPRLAITTPRLLAEHSATCRGCAVRAAGLKRERRYIMGTTGRCPPAAARGARRRAAQGDGQTGRVEDGRGSPWTSFLSFGGQRRPAQLVEHRLLRCARTARGAPGSRMTPPLDRNVSVATFPANSMVSLTGISSGVVTITRPSSEDRRECRGSSPSGSGSGHLDEVVDRLGRASCPTMWPVGRVHHDEVVVLFATS